MIIEENRKMALFYNKGIITHKACSLYTKTQIGKNNEYLIPKHK